MKKIIILTSLSFIILIGGCTPKQSETPQAAIVFIIGTVTVNSETSHIDTIINDGDVIETGPKSIARIRIGDKTLVQIKENSRLAYKLVSENTLQLDSGWMSGVTRSKLIKADYQIKTPTMVAAVRGTSYCLKIESPESTYFCTCNGTIHQHGIGNKDHAEDVTAAHHNARRFILENGTVKKETAKMLYHADKDIEELAEIMNESVDWENPY